MYKYYDNFINNEQNIKIVEEIINIERDEYIRSYYSIFAEYLLKDSEFNILYKIITCLEDIKTSSKRTFDFRGVSRRKKINFLFLFR